MRVVITGGAGFLGKKLTQALLEQGSIQDNKGHKQSITKLVIFDYVDTDLEIQDSRLETLKGDITNPETVKALIHPQTDVVIHLAAVVSGQAEQDFDLGMQVNFHATHNLLEACRRLETPPKFIFASSVAIFGGDMPEVIEDNIAPTPLNSYGSQKAMCELLINDYSRKGFIDARILRYPTIVVRPGKPNAATSTFASSIIREPLQGQSAICPVNPDTKLWILSPRQAIRSTLQALDLPAETLGAYRTLSLPGITVSVQEMVDGLRDIAGEATVQKIEREHDPFIQGIVGSWPSLFNTVRATGLGFVADESIKGIIQSFIDDDL